MLADRKYALYVIVLTMIYCTVSLYVPQETRRTAIEILPIKPDRCVSGDYELEYEDCCIFPPFYAREVSLSCGIRGIIKFTNFEQNVTSVSRTTLTCDSWTCILEKYNLLTPELLLDNKKFMKHMDRWVKLNPEFEDVMIKAKRFCRTRHFSNFPIHICDYFSYNNCFRTFIKMDCPLMIKSPRCEQQKKFYDDCRQYYKKK